MKVIADGRTVVVSEFEISKALRSPIRTNMIIEINVADIWLPLAVTTIATIILATVMLWQVSTLKCRRLHLWVGWLVDLLEGCHRLYVRSRRPKRIILMRHAESEGNVDKGMYTSTPDHALKITELGKRQAAIAGKELRNLIGNESVYFIVSPYTRTRMTYEIVKEALGQDRMFAVKEDPRLRELDFGNFQDLATMTKTMETRKAYGRFWFRFMNGESGADVYDRATAFWESVFRSMDHTTGRRFDNYVIITHGLMMRLILMRYFQWKVEFFERVWNPNNCETWVMERDERGSFRVVTEILDRPAWATGSNAPDSPGAKEAGNTSAGSVTSANRENRESNVRETKPEADADDVNTVSKEGGQIPARDPAAEMSQEPFESAGRAKGDLSGEARSGEDVEGDGCDGVCGDAEGMLAGREGSASSLGGSVEDNSTLRLTSGSVLQLHNGGYAPGEEECGRDEEL